MGVTSLAAGITQGFPIGGSGSRTAVNDQMGARTQLAGLLGAAIAALVLLFLTEQMQYLPKATLGAVIVAAAIGLVDRRAWQGLARTSRVEVAIAAVTMAGVVTVGVLEALVVAVRSRSWTSPAAAPPPTTRSSAGSSAWAATPTSASTRGPGSPQGCWCTGWTTGCSSPTPVTSRAGAAKPSTMTCGQSSALGDAGSPREHKA